MILIAITSASLPTKKRILTVCVKLFLEKGYKQTTLAEINEKAGVSFSQFQNIFRAKDGVLTELVEFMFENQFANVVTLTPVCPVCFPLGLHHLAVFTPWITVEVSR